MNSSARDSIANSKVAIKKILRPFDYTALAKRTYREVHLLRNLRHDNVCIYVGHACLALELLTDLN